PTISGFVPGSTRASNAMMENVLHHAFVAEATEGVVHIMEESRDVRANTRKLRPSLGGKNSKRRSRDRRSNQETAELYSASVPPDLVTVLWVVPKQTSRRPYVVLGPISRRHTRSSQTAARRELVPVHADTSDPR